MVQTRLSVVEPNSRFTPVIKGLHKRGVEVVAYVLLAVETIFDTIPAPSTWMQPRTRSVGQPLQSLPPTGTLSLPSMGVVETMTNPILEDGCRVIERPEGITVGEFTRETEPSSPSMNRISRCTV